MKPLPLKFTDPPDAFPFAQVSGAPLKPLTEVLLERRATSHFKPDPVPERYLEAILRFGMQAPSGYNLQPWRFIVVREPEARRRLRSVAMDQAKVSEAPVVIISFAVEEERRSEMDAILREGVRRGVGKSDDLPELKSTVSEFLDGISSSVWLNRHTMIAVTTMMLIAEAYGLDTAPMEGFDPAGVKREFGLPHSAEVVALLALGFAALPRKAYGGRISLESGVHLEHYGRPWATDTVKSHGEFPVDSGIVPVIDVGGLPGYPVGRI